MRAVVMIRDRSSGRSSSERRNSSGSRSETASPCAAMSDDVDSGDEVMECDGPFLAPVGSKIVTTHGGASSVGEVSAHSPSGQRMLVDLDGPTRWGQAWVALDEPWELSMGFEPAATGDEAAAEAAEADEAAAGAAAA